MHEDSGLGKKKIKKLNKLLSKLADRQKDILTAVEKEKKSSSGRPTEPTICPEVGKIDYSSGAGLTHTIMLAVVFIMVLYVMVRCTT